MRPTLNGFFLALALLLSLPLAAPAQTGQAALLQFQKLEDAWSIALVNKDQYGLENLLQPTFIDISAAGAINTRNQSIADILAGLPEPLVSVEQKVVNVHIVSDIAVVEGTYVLRLKEDQRTRDERGIFTHVYQRSHNTWSCISAQRTAVVDQLEGGKGRTTRAGAKAPTASNSTAQTADKKSSASLPFHIPLLHKGDDSATPAPTTAEPPPH